jgi:hypothetical protein
MDPFRHSRLNELDQFRLGSRQRSSGRPYDTLDGLTRETELSPSKPSYSSKPRVQLRDLCPEDKAKIGRLVKELAKEKHERKQLHK